MVYYLIFSVSLFMAFSAVSVYGIIDRWFWPWIALLAFLGIFALGIAFYLLYCAVLSLFVDKEKPITHQNRYFYHLLCQTAFLLLRVLRVKVHFEGKEFIPKDSKFLLVCNHLCWMDPAVPLLIFKSRRIAFVSKKETHSWPVAGSFLHETACLPIDRENNREALKTINSAAELIEKGVCSIGIFPEGWVSQSGELLEFRPGAFRIAKKACCPVVVCHISGTEKISKTPVWKKRNVYFEIKGVIPEEYVIEHKTAEISELAREIMTK
ncbi:MAG: 1-acyl-sn-glycerol-3-phosphate acyltransferase [Oscillospiraceae bacterium]|nr:1-acyl-sn-glycerol-3-phosphate acyltransferase [Oscillospiraceae bacterium]